MKNKKETILITGAGSGFGKETAFRMVKKNYHVIAAVETPSQIFPLKEIAKKEKLDIQFEKLDLTNTGDRERAANWDVDILLNNGAISEGGAVIDLPEYILRQQFEVNVFGTILLTQIVARNMVKKKKGFIVFMSSVAGITTDPFAGAYSSTKHAIEAFAEAFNKELKEFGIKIATINPGPIYTGFNDRMFEGPLHWYEEDLENAIFDYKKIAFPHEQYIPEHVFDKTEKVLSGELKTYRNVVPDDIVEDTKKQMDEVWTRMQNSKAQRDPLVQKAYDIKPETKNGK
ncbi:SDR family oxidoreductase [Rhizosphaericola mali]|uniref:SDR family oxidoreductase n=1 Tax=Rhizosphaericola mali TaxID=2545455 RepID=A0A5P2G079_9BACT|nr:SDR family oxidoreductase [Rhizosphaericola mali]QES88627.1 SDR family oxidoreductase [Rhizosphaericola mali]